MVIVVVPDSWSCGTPYKWPKLLVNGGDPNHLPTGMILQVLPIFKVMSSGSLLTVAGYFFDTRSCIE